MLVEDNQNESVPSEAQYVTSLFASCPVVPLHQPKYEVPTPVPIPSYDDKPLLALESPPSRPLTPMRGDHNFFPTLTISPVSTVRPSPQSRLGRKYVESRGACWKKRKKKDFGIHCPRHSLLTLFPILGCGWKTRPLRYDPIGGRPHESTVLTLGTLIILNLTQIAKSTWKNFSLINFKKRYKWKL